ncbi:nuclear transport factor 2 family protein [Bradyrhizobium ganzhouense]|uniref:nuclear transport factor 2 family protein n=1 Tax=Bradyrhizobium ganzhouense TaxID=1179767 RepID=UPI003CF9470E
MHLNLEAAERVRNKQATYCRHLDTKQFDKWETIFKADTPIIFYNADNSIFAEFNSVAELASMTRRGLFATTRTIHQGYISEIEFRFETQATPIQSKEDGHIDTPDGATAPKTMHGYGFYYETWELADGEWKLASLELRRNLVTHSHPQSR